MTAAPAARASAAVSSVEPSSITSTSNAGACARSARITLAIEPLSLYAGTIARREPAWNVAE